ncbi:MAG: carbohydrate binding family 9 domain-containing protein [Proteobacteria bacterium]|nr:carbohydrate binding family 9 domain-containing protein [Pseudomonadota bacterium]
MRSYFLLGLLLLGISRTAAPHEIGSPETRVAPAVKIDTPPVIDGILDDPIWTKGTPPEKVEVHSGFFDVRTDGHAAEQTFVQIAYDDEFIYVAWECLQDETSVNATERKRDRFQVRLDDYVQVGFDTFHDHGRAYIFLVSALGTQWDSRDGLSGRNQSWDADWLAATSIGEDRWFAEMAIPIGVMHHDHEPDQLWGLNFRRRISRQNDSSHWNYNADAGFTFRAQGPKFVGDFHTDLI